MSGALSSSRRLQAVVAVDDAAVEVVEVGGREAAAVERHQRTQVRRQHRQHGQHHPLRAVARLEEGLDQLEALGQALELGLRSRCAAISSRTLDHLRRAGRCVRSSSWTASAPMRASKSSPCSSTRRRYCSSVSSWPRSSVGHARLDDDVGFEVQDALDVAQRHVEHQADARRQRLQEPDVRDRGGQLDVAHALAAHLGLRHLDAALLADDAAVLHALVLAAQALVVLDRAEDLGAEQAVALRLERAVVDRFRLLHFAERPRPDHVRRSQRDAGSQSKSSSVGAAA